MRRWRKPNRFSRSWRQTAVKYRSRGCFWDSFSYAYTRWYGDGYLYLVRMRGVITGASSCKFVSGLSTCPNAVVSHYRHWRDDQFHTHLTEHRQKLFVISLTLLPLSAHSNIHWVIPPLQPLLKIQSCRACVDTHKYNCVPLWHTPI